MRILALLILAVFLTSSTGCTYTYVDFSSGTLRQHLSDLQTRSEARVVDTEGRRQRIGVADAVTVNRPDMGTTTIGRLAHMCDGSATDFSPLPGGTVARCDLVSDALVTRRQVDVGATAEVWLLATFATGAVAGGAYCLSQCSEQAKAALSTALGVVSVASLALVLYIVVTLQSHGHGAPD